MYFEKSDDNEEIATNKYSNTNLTLILILI